METASTLNIILHSLYKNEQGQAAAELAQGKMAASPVAQRLVEHLSALYAAKQSKGYGRFEEDETLYPLPRLLREYALENTLSFVELSQKMMGQLTDLLREENIFDVGHVLFARAQHSESVDFLFVAIIGEAQSFTLNDNGELVEQAYLDLDKLRVAGRIDLAAWRNDDGRYISFLKGRTDVAAYFKRFLGCDDVVAALKETKKLIKGIEQFAETQQLEPQARDELYENAHRYLEDLGENSVPWDVDTVAATIAPQQTEALRSTLRDEQLGLREGCIPDRRAIRPLLRLKAAAQNWKLEFNRSGLRSGDVAYDRAHDTIVLANVPEDIKRELLADPSGMQR